MPTEVKPSFSELTRNLDYVIFNQKYVRLYKMSVEMNGKLFYSYYYYFNWCNICAGEALM